MDILASIVNSKALTLLFAWRPIKLTSFDSCPILSHMRNSAIMLPLAIQQFLWPNCSNFQVQRSIVVENQPIYLVDACRVSTSIFCELHFQSTL